VPFITTVSFPLPGVALLAMLAFSKNPIVRYMHKSGNKLK
jgi:hypothetical protein